MQCVSEMRPLIINKQMQQVKPENTKTDIT